MVHNKHVCDSNTANFYLGRVLGPVKGLLDWRKGVCALQDGTRRIKSKVWVHKSPSLGLGCAESCGIVAGQVGCSLFSPSFSLAWLKVFIRPKCLPDLLRFHQISEKNQILEGMNYGHYPLGCSTCAHILGGSKIHIPVNPIYFSVSLQ